MDIRYNTDIYKFEVLAVADERIEVGEYIQAFNDLTAQNIPCGKIYQSSGLKTHVERHHPDEVDLIRYVPDVIREPEYIGKHPKEGSSVELIKKINKNVMVCIKLDNKNGYLYVASVFSISEAKLNNRLNSGRVKRC